ncbi:carbohydrate kinase family protein [Candidatus Venteria ishoeyi]|uniref:2-dehydro-3-deoxygluconokinase n=1 Tax=Candidatus Venteria ishoeyi TaxID=1899563 RepID=A0A1H6FD69_9GAMM|nr:carbohydrate kinase [Candidatus Venteria ishoeyi]MDM8548375.1 carbohydrate kinase [Candidatus Venteria ishoeyi]SEH06965.1 2-dehydro-3-deoxygluconokinase [Candidatus Venteria ishoeyi]
MTKKLCIFGEVLFDIFPDGHRVLGGAPFNVAWHLQAFAQAPFFISRVGNDPEAAHIRKAMLDWGMNTQALQTDETLATGKVMIELERGEPQYDIIAPAAYDAIEPPSDHVSACDFLYHGSLALRNECSSQTLRKLKDSKPGIVFVDVNLRSPWWEKAVVLELLQQADWVKLNVEEFNLLYASDKTGQHNLSVFIYEYALQGVILTHGEAGAEIMTANMEQYAIKPNIEVKIVDTVGAGDAFSAVIILGLIHHWSLQTTLQRAQDFASAMVAQRGATVAEADFYQHFMNKWRINLLT